MAEYLFDTDSMTRGLIYTRINTTSDYNYALTVQFITVNIGILAL